MRARFHSTRAAGGFTLIELLIVMSILALLASIAGPKFTNWFELLRARSVMERLIADMFAARQLAIRFGEPVELRFETDAGATCVYGYEMVAIGLDDRLVKRVDFTAAERARCMTSGKLTPMRYSSRGLLRPFDNRTFTVHHTTRTDSVAVSVLGRPRRSYRRRGRNSPRRARKVGMNRRAAPGKIFRRPAISASRRRLVRTNSLQTGGFPNAACFFLYISSFLISKSAAAAGAGLNRWRQARRPLGRGGFSLVEVPFAAMLLGLGVIALSYVGMSSVRRVIGAGLETDIAQQAATVVERMTLAVRDGTDPAIVCDLNDARFTVDCVVETAASDPSVPDGVTRISVEVRSVTLVGIAGSPAAVTFSASLR